MVAEITPAELRNRLDSDDAPRLLDVRTRDEHDLVSFTGARLIPLHELPERSGEVAGWKNLEVVVICHHGVRSAQAAFVSRQCGISESSQSRGRH